MQKHMLCLDFPYMHSSIFLNLCKSCSALTMPTTASTQAVSADVVVAERAPGFS